MCEEVTICSKQSYVFLWLILSGDTFGLRYVINIINFYNYNVAILANVLVMVTFTIREMLIIKIFLLLAHIVNDVEFRHSTRSSEKA